MAARRLRLDRTLGPIVAAWIERMLVHGPGDVQGQRIELDDEFVRFLCRAYEIDDAGRRVVRRAVLSRPKGRAKSEFAGMIACAEGCGPVRFRGWDHDGKPLAAPVQAAYVPCVATEEGQAADNVYAAAYFMLREGAVSRLEGLDVGLTRTYVPGGGKIQAITAKSTSKDGGRETCAIFDETHLFVAEDLRRLHATIRRNLAKRKIAQPWSLEVSTMYAPGENSVAEASHDYARKVAAGKIHDAGFLFDHREGTDPAKFDWDSDEQLRAALAEAYGDAAGWTDLERIIQEIRDPQSERSDSVRYFINRPAKRESALYIRSAVWDALADAGLGSWGEIPAVVAGQSAAIGADGSRTYDTTAVAWAVPQPDGRILCGARVFSVRAHVAHHVLHEGGRIDYDDVEAFLIDAFGQLAVREAAYDPRYLERSAEIVDRRLSSGYIFPVEPQSKQMREALACLDKAVADERIIHAGDPVIAAHLGNCAADRGEQGEIRRLRKINATKPIDAVPPLALAVWRATVGSMEPAEPLVAIL